MSSWLARQELRSASPGRPTSVTVGKFDGVHIGHQALIRFLKQRAEARKLASAVVTFHPNPISVLRPGTRVTYLTSLEERLELLHAQGVDCVAPVTFTDELAQCPAEEFALVLKEEIGMSLLVGGPDLALGRNREGTPDRMRGIGSSLGFDVEIVDFYALDGKRAGSSAIRAALATGDMEEVARLLGRPFSLRGPVVYGAMRGHSIGFPTANIDIPADRELPGFGVYATRAHVAGQVRDAVTNIGRRPTFDNGTPSIETHILDFTEDLYGRELRIDVLARLRGEEKFSSIEGLREQIDRDICKARLIFG